MKLDLSLAQARRIALTAQGFNGLTRSEPVSAAQLGRSLAKLGLLQIDSVNVLVRAQYLPLYSRLGNYDRVALDALVAARPKRYFEYWGHEASLLPVALHPLLRWRMARALRGQGVWRQLAPYAHEKRPEAEALLARIGAEGPLAASDVAGGKAAKGMWVWSNAKHALEWLFWAGLVAATHRRGSFERVYDLPERVLPRAVLQLPTPDDTDARRGLLQHAARALGIATADDLRDYYRLPAADVRLPLEQLVEEGVLIPTRVRGWTQPAYLHRDARAGRKIAGAALLSPFDPLIWHRPRTERLFGFRYRLEIYTPAHKREHGYYVLPFLLDGALVARVDLKADRKTATLWVQRVHVEPGAPPSTLARLADELRLMAAWLGLLRLAVAADASGEPLSTMLCARIRQAMADSDGCGRREQA
ncbi:winged helix-turn-helix domain-containing protein [Sodalis praecaptivus]|uniref:winged helix-turn-helix domain-containing protein n=1 Tax=Sodalis praecaptivus TaxID=1239307 RepID=UPI00046D3C85|nr:crosslink repair DNA glycosylase YcaQ family protein [Sodalis praecaptivus]